MSEITYVALATALIRVRFDILAARCSDVLPDKISYTESGTLHAALQWGERSILVEERFGIIGQYDERYLCLQ